MSKFITALYGRTSKDDPKRVTIEIQQQTLRVWSQNDQLVERVVDEYWDDGVTGKIPLWERPQGRRLVEDIKSGRIQSVAVAYADRFGRTLLDGLQAVKLLEDNGVKLVAVTDGWDSRRSDAPLYFQFRMMMAEEEHRRISQRMSDGKKRAMTRDEAPPGGPLAFGYHLDKRGHYVPDPVESAIVIEIFRMALEGHRFTEILEYIKSCGVPAGRKFQKRAEGSRPTVCRNHNGAAWHLTKVAKILRNPVYTGVRTWGSASFPCIPLVNKPTFDKVQLICADKARRFGIGKADPERGLVSGLFVCETCGSRFYHKSCISYYQGKIRDRYQMYICDSLRRRKNCRAKMIRVAHLDADIWKFVLSYLENPEKLIKKVLFSDTHLQTEASVLISQEADIVRQLELLELEVQEVWDLKNGKGLPLSFVSNELSRLNLRKEGLAAQLSQVRSQYAAMSLTRDETNSLISTLAQVRSELSEGVLSAQVKFDLVRRFIRSGSIKTEGSGRHKVATVSFQFLWGEGLTTQAPKVPIDWSNGSQGTREGSPPTLVKKLTYGG